MKKAFVLLVFWLASALAWSQTLEIDAKVEKDRVLFHGWSEDPSGAAIHLWDRDRHTVGATQIEGAFLREDGAIAFRPAFPFLEDTGYVLIRRARGTETLLRFAMSPPDQAPPRVVAIYPTSDVLPENLLRLYVEYSQPMKTTGNLDEIRIYDAKGDAVSGVLFNNVVELWDPAQTQPTLIFDPARVKTGLQANEALGRALMPGETYRLAITKGEDVYGRELEAPFTKAFRVVAQDVTAPDMAAWSVALPPKATRAALEIRFPAQIDRMSLLTRLRPLDSAGRPVPGSIRIGEGETLWAFTPSRPWQPGDYAISVNTRLADPSGNNLNGLFDHKSGSLSGPEGQTRSLPFVIE